MPGTEQEESNEHLYKYSHLSFKHMDSCDTFVFSLKNQQEFEFVNRWHAVYNLLCCLMKGNTQCIWGFVYVKKCNKIMQNHSMTFV